MWRCVSLGHLLLRLQEADESHQTNVNKTLKHLLNISVFRKIFCLFEGAILQKIVQLSNPYAQMWGSQFAKLAV